MMATPHSPKSSQMLTPPRSPGGDKYMGRTFSPKLKDGLLFDIKSSPNPSMHESDPEFNFSKGKASSSGDTSADQSKEYPLNPQWSKTDGAALAKAFKQG